MDSPETSKSAIEPEVEGVDDGATDGWGDYPLDAVFVRTENRTVAEVVKRIENDRFVLDPDFQREFVWPNQKQSKLIESSVMRIPLPVFYVAEAPDGRIIVVDGLQRLTTFARFVGNKFKLVGLASGEDGTGSHALEGRYFKDLPITLQERVQDTQLTMYILDAKAPERARLDIFERVNSGEPLTRQQMRNALYNGPATNWLRSAAESSIFQAATGKTLNPKTMRDREAINRFCAFKLLGREHYTTGDMDRFLAEGLKKLANLSEDARTSLRTSLDNVLALNTRLFGEHAFRKSLASASPHASRSVINISLFDVCTVCMADDSVIEHVGELGDGYVARLRENVIALMSDEEFSRAITYSTNSTKVVQNRFEIMELAVRRASTT